MDIGVGGSIAFVTAYAAAFPAAEILITGVEDPGTQAHAANESLDLAVFERACLAEALLLDHLGVPGHNSGPAGASCGNDPEAEIALGGWPPVGHARAFGDKSALGTTRQERHAGQ